MVSICILNMNRVETLKETVLLLDNLSIENEIIVFDQNSNDGSVEFLKKQNNIKLFLSETNVGNSISRNKMIQSCKYDYVFLLDSDIVPIKNSIEHLYQFMVENKNYSFIGYDYENCSNIKSEATITEHGINRKDVVTGIRIALTQYGIFRKKDLLECPFPEFEPFNQEGWGAEDDLVGMTINDNKLGITGKIVDRTYYHNHQMSSWKYINDEVKRLYGLRYIVYRYFDWFLTPSQKIETLKSNKLPLIKLDLSKYHWDDGNNFGDVATDWVLKKYFSFFEFSDSSDNLLFFGGSILEHYPNARKKYNKDFKKIIMFGVGISDETFSLPPTDFEVYPRGSITKNKLESKGIICKRVVGDVLQLLSLIPKKSTVKSDTLLIQDVFDELNIENEGVLVRVSEFEPYLENAPFMNIEEFLDSPIYFNKIISSQVHPFFYFVLSGKSAKLIIKDLRASDLKFFENIKFNSNEQDSLSLRDNIHSNIPKFVDNFFNVLRLYT